MASLDITFTKDDVLISKEFKFENFKSFYDEKYWVINRIDWDGNMYFVPVSNDNTVNLNERSIVDERSLEEEDQQHIKKLHQKLYTLWVVNPEFWFVC